MWFCFLGKHSASIEWSKDRNYLWLFAILTALCNLCVSNSINNFCSFCFIPLLFLSCHICLLCSRDFPICLCQTLSQIQILIHFQALLRQDVYIHLISYSGLEPECDPRKAKKKENRPIKCDYTIKLNSIAWKIFTLYFDVLYRYYKCKVKIL